MSIVFPNPAVARLMEEDYQRRVEEGIKAARERNPELWAFLDSLRNPPISEGT